MYQGQGLAFQEYHENVPHKKLSLGYAGEKNKNTEIKMIGIGITIGVVLMIEILIIVMMTNIEQ